MIGYNILANQGLFSLGWLFCCDTNIRLKLYQKAGAKPLDGGVCGGLANYEEAAAPAGEPIVTCPTACGGVWKDGLRLRVGRLRPLRLPAGV